MIEEIIAELTTELQIADPHLFNADLLRVKVIGAYRDVRSELFKHTSSYSEADIEREMNNYYSNVLAIARYDYNKIGAEGQKSYHEDGVTKHYDDRDALFHGVLPKAKKA